MRVDQRRISIVTGKSLRLRLLVIAVASILLALVIAGIGLAAIFERHVLRRVEAELAGHLRQLAGEVAFGEEGQLQIGREPAESRFHAPLSGLYWQVTDTHTGTRLRSRSLWEHALQLPQQTKPVGTIQFYQLTGPSGATLHVADRVIDYGGDAPDRVVRLAVAVDRADIVSAREEFTLDATRSLALLAIVLLIAAWMQIIFGLRPLEAVRRSVNQVRSGHQPRITVDEPTEVMPLVAEVNSLLDAQDKAIEAARRRAADLAHGLKSPLQILTMDAERLRARGENKLADEIEELAEGMRRHVSRELTRARLQPWAGIAPSRASVAGVIDQLTRTLARTPKGQAVRFDVVIAPDVVAAMQSEDLTEMCGNLLDNALKWAAGEVRVRAVVEHQIELTIEDDGPGVTPELLTRLGQRGLRLDQTVEGTGLGLAIAIDIAEAYGARLTFANRSMGGFRATVTLPRPG